MERYFVALFILFKTLLRSGNPKQPGITLSLENQVELFVPGLNHVNENRH